MTHNGFITVSSSRSVTFVSFFRCPFCSFAFSLFYATHCSSMKRDLDQTESKANCPSIRFYTHDRRAIHGASLHHYHTSSSPIAYHQFRHNVTTATASEKVSVVCRSRYSRHAPRPHQGISLLQIHFLVLRSCRIEKVLSLDLSTVVRFASFFVVSSSSLRWQLWQSLFSTISPITFDINLRIKYSHRISWFLTLSISIKRRSVCQLFSFSLSGFCVPHVLWFIDKFVDYLLVIFIVFGFRNGSPYRFMNRINLSASD